MLKFTPFPTWIEYSDDIPEGTGAYAKLCYVRIRNKYRSTDKGIHMHEYLHVQQWYILFLAWSAMCIGVAGVISPQYDNLVLALTPFGVLIHPLLYRLISEYKLACEVDCYQEQAKYYADDRRPLFAKFISRDYGLSISEDDALKLLSE